MQLLPWWNGDRTWGLGSALIAGAALAGLLKAGYSRKKAEQMAEIAGYKHLLKDITY